MLVSKQNYDSVTMVDQVKCDENRKRFWEESQVPIASNEKCEDED